MLNEWLSADERDPQPYRNFKTIDSIEKVSVLSEIRDYLIGLTLAETYDLEFLKEMVEGLGEDYVKELMIRQRSPTLVRVRRGDFGEVLANAVLEHFYGYIIPVRKLRFKIIGNQTLPGTDTLAIKIEYGRIAEVCFVESKLRTSPNSRTAVEAYEQLREDFNSQRPDILNFIAARLYDQQSSLFHAFRDYMRDRSESTERDTFWLGLCFDVECWNENVLESLEENSSDIPRLTAHAIRINRLRQLTDDVFQNLGIMDVSDDD